MCFLSTKDQYSFIEREEYLSEIKSRKSIVFNEVLNLKDEKLLISLFEEDIYTNKDLKKYKERFSFESLSFFLLNSWTRTHNGVSLRPRANIIYTRA